MRSTTVIDIHAHHVNPDGLEEMRRVAPSYTPRLRRRAKAWSIDIPPGLVKKFPDGTRLSVPAGLVDIDSRISEMDGQGVQFQALRNYTSLNFTSLAPDIAAQLHAIHNDAMISLARQLPDRFVALPSLPMQDTELAIAEVKRLAAYPQVAGLAIGTHISGVDLDAGALTPLWQAIEEVGLPLLLHPPGAVAGADRMGAYHLGNLIGNPLESTVALGRIVLSGLLDRFPRLRFLFVHGGGFTPYQIGRWDHAWRVRKDTSQFASRPPSEYLRDQCYFDSLTHDADALQFLGNRVGWSHVLLGTDYPWDMGTMSPLESLGAVGLDDTTWSSVVGGNAKAFLRWPTQADV